MKHPTFGDEELMIAAVLDDERGHTAREVSRMYLGEGKGVEYERSHRIVRRRLEQLASLGVAWKDGNFPGQWRITSLGDRMIEAYPGEVEGVTHVRIGPRQAEIVATLHDLGRGQTIRELADHLGAGCDEEEVKRIRIQAKNAMIRLAKKGAVARIAPRRWVATALGARLLRAYPRSICVAARPVHAESAACVAK